MKLKNIAHFFNVLFLSIGAIVGVGFVSGAEIWTFFARFGSNFYASIIVFFVVLTLFCIKILREDEQELKMLKMHKNTINETKNTIFIKSIIKQKLLFCEIILVAATMIAGLKSLLFKLLNNNQILIFAISIIIVFLLTLMGMNFISKLNLVSVLALFLMLGILILNLGCHKDVTVFDLSMISPMSIKNISIGMFFSLTYIFMNITHLIPILKTECKFQSIRQKNIFAICFSLSIVLMIFIMVLFLNKYSFLSSSDMPIFEFFKSRGRGFNIFYSIVLLGGLFSTILVCLDGLKKDILNRLNSSVSASFFAVLLPLILGVLPFNFFINIIYPVIGVTNFVILLFL